MMRRYFAYLLILIIAVCIGLVISTDPGYALFYYHHTTIEMPLWLACLIAMIFIILLIGFLRLIDNTRSLLTKFSYWRQKRKFLKTQQKAERDLLDSLKSIYLEGKQWQKLDALLPKLNKYHLLSKQDQLLLEIKQSTEHLFKTVEPTKQWRQLSWRLRTQPELIIVYAHALIQAKNFTKAQVVLERYLKRHWDDRVCEYYGNLETFAADKQLKFMEKYFIEQRNNPVLLAALGKLHERLKIWGKAKTYYQQSLAIQPSIDIYKRLGQLLEHLGESQEALKYYRRALELKALSPHIQ